MSVTAILEKYFKLLCNLYSRCGSKIVLLLLRNFLFTNKMLNIVFQMLQVPWILQDRLAYKNAHKPTICTFIYNTLYQRPQSILALYQAIFREHSFCVNASYLLRIVVCWLYVFIKHITINVNMRK
jgi:hypothetical protein